MKIAQFNFNSQLIVTYCHNNLQSNNYSLMMSQKQDAVYRPTLRGFSCLLNAIDKNCFANDI